MDKLKLIKSIVFVLTFLLVFGSLLVLGSLFRQTRPRPLPSDVNLNQPAGSSVEKIVANDGLLYILIKGGGNPDRIVVFDTRSGQPLTALKLN